MIMESDIRLRAIEPEDLDLLYQLDLPTGRYD